MYRSTYRFEFSGSHRPFYLQDDRQHAPIHTSAFAVDITFAAGVLVGGSVVSMTKLGEFNRWLRTIVHRRNIVGILSTPTGPQFALALSDAEMKVAEDDYATTVSPDIDLQPVTPETLARAFYDICRANCPETDSVRVTTGQPQGVLVAEYSR